MKKSKLFLSLMSLCFSLAVLCFGVYAAQQVDYQISGNISYDVSDAYVDMHTMVYTFDGDMPTSRKDLKALADLFPDETEYTSFASIASLNDLTQVGTSAYNSVNGAVSGATLDGSDVLMSGLSLDLDTDDNKAYVIVVNIKNLGDNDIYARLSDAQFYAKVGNDYSQTPMTSDAVVASNLMRYQKGGKSVIEKNDVVNLVYVFGIEDMTIQIADMKFEYTFEIKNGAYTTQILKFNTTDEYYYVEMGEYDNNPIRWRLISVDGGLTKYTAPQGTSDSSSEPTGDCVFIQETNTMTDSVREIDGSDIYLNGVSYQTDYYFKGFNGGMPQTDEEYQQIYLYDWNESNFVYTADGLKIKANDYSMSTIRQYLKGNTVYKHVNYDRHVEESGWNAQHDTTFQSNILSDYIIDASNDDIYTKIISRTLKDMYKNIGAAWGDDGIEYSNMDIPKHMNSIGINALDKLWLLSVEELYDLFWEESGDDLIQDGASWYDCTWWLRSNDLYSLSYAWMTAGGADGDYIDSCSFVARPAFILSL